MYGFSKWTAAQLFYVFLSVQDRTDAARAHRHASRRDILRTRCGFNQARQYHWSQAHFTIRRERCHGGIAKRPVWADQQIAAMNRHSGIPDGSELMVTPSAVLGKVEAPSEVIKARRTHRLIAPRRPKRAAPPPDHGAHFPSFAHRICFPHLMSARVVPATGRSATGCRWTSAPLGFSLSFRSPPHAGVALDPADTTIALPPRSPTQLL
jgi:hypothetical protein